MYGLLPLSQHSEEHWLAPHRVLSQEELEQKEIDDLQSLASDVAKDAKQVSY